MKLNYLTPKQTAELWESPRISVYVAIKEGRLACMRLGPRTILIPKPEALAYKARLDANRAKRLAKQQEANNATA